MSFIMPISRFIIIVFSVCFYNVASAAPLCSNIFQSNQEVFRGWVDFSKKHDQHQDDLLSEAEYVAARIHF